MPGAEREELPGEASALPPQWGAGRLPRGDGQPNTRELWVFG